MNKYEPIIHVTVKVDDVLRFHANHNLASFTGWGILHDLIHSVYNIGFTRYDELIVEILHAMCKGLSIDEIMNDERVIGAQSVTEVTDTKLETLVGSCGELWSMYQVGVIFPISKKVFNINAVIQLDNVAQEYVTECDIYLKGSI